MLGRTSGAVLIGVDARPVTVEVDLANGLPTIVAVGLAGSSVREGIDRVRAALRHAGYKLPNKKVVVNLAPADLPKHGTSLDLPIAVALLIADGKLRPEIGSALFVGELALDGTTRPVRGALSYALAARKLGRTRLVLPESNADEASLVDGIEVIGVTSLAEVTRWTRGTPPSVHLGCGVQDRLDAAGEQSTVTDLAEVRGQAVGRRVLEISAAGGHHLLLSGPPGSGKTMLARRLPGILPRLEPDEAIVVTRIWSAAGLRSGLITERPFRAPHHGVSSAGLTGGGPGIRPGEITLASHGVLYLDELTEFRRDALEALRQPLEDGVITISRVHATATMPAPFTLVASMNPCPCGHHGNPKRDCCCSPRQVHRYKGRLSGPLLDRFDLFVEIPPADLAALGTKIRSEASSTVRARVIAARYRQQDRLRDGATRCNARMTPTELDRHAAIDPASRRLLLAACDRLGLTARGFDRIRRVARTIADLAGEGRVLIDHVAEALRYRHGV